MRVLSLHLAVLLAAQAGANSDRSARRLPVASASETQAVLDCAKTFFSDLIAGRAREVAAQSDLPFQLENRRISSRDQLVAEWTRNLADKRLDLLTLYGIEVLAPSEMEKKYGDPPARLSRLPWRNEKTYLAVANLSGRAAIAVFRRTPSGWRAVGYTD